ncbi:hypothetical protein Agub_g5499 [Astrephomene gubernaculifera]|uniref:Uncharacterized protein n=1 Tax=Astrephomene gubernaculifera TaxID=47775 RepID=A0AAD3DLZ0_9CHLO|nr:hypothetical protein Agub_g5499 [Astrephomene gubernaculifera]
MDNNNDLRSPPLYGRLLPVGGPPKLDKRGGRELQRSKVFGNDCSVPPTQEVSTVIQEHLFNKALDEQHITSADPLHHSVIGGHLTTKSWSTLHTYLALVGKEVPSDISSIILHPVSSVLKLLKPKQLKQSKAAATGKQTPAAQDASAAGPSAAGASAAGPSAAGASAAGPSAAGASAAGPSAAGASAASGILDGAKSNTNLSIDLIEVPYAIREAKASIRRCIQLYVTECGTAYVLVIFLGSKDGTINEQQEAAGRREDDDMLPQDVAAAAPLPASNKAHANNTPGALAGKEKRKNVARLPAKSEAQASAPQAAEAVRKKRKGSPAQNIPPAPSAPQVANTRAPPAGGNKDAPPVPLPANSEAQASAPQAVEAVDKKRRGSPAQNIPPAPSAPQVANTRAPPMLPLAARKNVNGSGTGTAAVEPPAPVAALAVATADSSKPGSTIAVDISIAASGQNDSLPQTANAMHAVSMSVDASLFPPHMAAAVMADGSGTTPGGPVAGAMQDVDGAGTAAAAAVGAGVGQAQVVPQLPTRAAAVAAAESPVAATGGSGASQAAAGEEGPDAGIACMKFLGAASARIASEHAQMTDFLDELYKVKERIGI